MSPESGPEAGPPGGGRPAGLVGLARSAGARRLVAARRIAAGARLLRIEGMLTRLPTRYSVQVSETHHVDLPSGMPGEVIQVRHYWHFMNHGCDPNTWILNREVIALHDIEPGADVTFNYNTTEFDLAEPFACHCGSPACLGTIRGFRYLAAAQRERLRPMLAPHLLRLLAPSASPES